MDIERFPKLRVRVQPLGKGFHVEENSQVANIDLKSILQRVLSQQTTITQNDLIPIRHEGRTYILAVRELWPEPQAVLLDTDVEVDLMPSEETMKEIEKQEKIRVGKVRRKERAVKLSEFSST